jgi:tape measure domain-containing protein
MDLGTMVVTYSGDVGQFIAASDQAKSAISSTADSAQSSGSGILGGFGKAISGAVGFASSVGQTLIGVKAFASTAIDLGSALLGPATSAETIQTAFTTLLGSTSAANAELQKLDAFASKTPFQTMDIDQAASQLIGFGVSAQDTIPDLTAIGDALSAVGKGSTANLGSVVDIFGKIQTEGGLTVGTMQQMSRDGINAWAVLEKETGKTKDQLTTMIQQGLFPAKTALDDLTKGIEKNPLYAGGMAKQSNTMVGIISTLKSNWDQMLVSFGSPIIKGLEGGLASVGQALTSPAFKSFAGGVGQAIANVFSDIGGFISNDVIPAFHALQPVAQQFITYFQSDQFAGIVADFQTVGNQINRIAGDFQQAAGPANNLVNGALSSLPGILEGIFQAADDVIFPLGQFLIWMQGASPWAEVVKDGLIGIGVAMASIKVGSLLAMLPELIATYGFWAGAAWGVVVAEWATLAPMLLVAAGIAIAVGLIVLAVTHWGEIAHWIQGVWSNVTSGIGGAFSAIGTKAHDATTGIGNAFSNLGTSMHDKGKDIVQTVQNIGTGAVEAGKWMYAHNVYWKASVDDITAGVTKAKVWISNEWTTITTWIGNQWLKWSTLARTYFALVEFVIEQKIISIVSSITAKWTQIHNWITDKWNGLKGLAQDALNGVFFVFDTIWSRISSPLTTASNNTKSWFENLASDAFGFGQGIIQGIINGIGSMFSNLGSIASQGAGIIAKYLGFHSPAKAGPGAELDVWGPNLVKGFASGIDRSAPILTASVNHLMSVGTYPIRPSATAVASSVVASGGNNGSNSSGNNTFIFEVDGQQLARITQPHVDGLVRLKMGPRGRVA